MKILLSRDDNLESTKIDVEVCDKNGRTPFHLACIYGHYDVAKTLLQAGGANPMVWSRE